MKEIICEAIRQKQRIKFEYNEKLRVGEPQCCGQTSTGKDAVRVHLTFGGSRPEQLFELDKMMSVELLNEHFTKPGPNYKRNDSAMLKIYCQL
jgi:hypothetical protein